MPEVVRRVADAGIDVPIIGDFHYNGHLLLARYPEAARTLAKYRINPGNVGGKRRDENFRTIVQIAVDHDKPVRIGVNWGSLDQDLLTAMMDANASAAPPRDAKDVYIEAMLRAPCAARRSPRKWGCGTTRSSSRARSRRCRTRWTPIAGLPRVATIRCTLDLPRPGLA